jgi:hypothetical protein
MKTKIILLFVTILIYGCESSTVEIEKSEPINKVADDSISKNRSTAKLIYKRLDFYGESNNFLFNIVKTYDFTSKDTLKTLQFIYTNFGETYRNEITKEDLELMIEGYKYAFKSLIIKPCKDKEMLHFKTVEGIIASAFPSESLKKWHFFIQITDDSNSTLYMNETECRSLVDYLESCKKSL